MLNFMAVSHSNTVLPTIFRNPSHPFSVFSNVEITISQTFLDELSTFKKGLLLFHILPYIGQGRSGRKI